MPRSSEVHSEKFRGVFIPARVFYLFKDGKITATEMCLLAVIDSLTDYRENVPCYASNEYFSRYFNRSTRQIISIISKLVKMNLVERIYFDGRHRCLKVCFNGQPYSEKNHDMGKSNHEADFMSGMKQTSSPLLTSFPFRKVGFKEDNIEDKNFGSAEGIFSDQNCRQKVTKYTNQDLKCAEKLMDIIKDKKDLSFHVPPSAWANTFRIIREVDGVGRTRMMSALKWYIRNIGKKFVPSVYNAKQFRSKFLSIEDAMNRTDDSDQSKTADIKVGPLAGRITDRLLSRNWPKGSATDVGAVVQHSLDEYGKFLDKMNRLTAKISLDNGKRGQPIKKLLNYLMETIPPSSQFVEGWMEEVNDNVSNWSAWSGNLNQMGVKIEGKRFMGVGREWSNDFCGDPGRWDELMEKCR